MGLDWDKLDYLAGQYLASQQMGQKLVYVCHPLRGPNQAENVASATNICPKLTAERKVIPFSPLHAFGFLDPKTADNHQAMQFCFALLGSCDELWVYGKWWTSEGCMAEMCWAACHGIPIRFK